MATVQEIQARLERETQGLPPRASWPGEQTRQALKKPSKKPTRKVGAGLITGILAAVSAFVADRYGITLDPELVAALVTLLSFGTSYIVPE